MNIEKIYMHTYVCCLPKTMEAKIMKAVRKKISSLLLSEEEKQAAIKNAQIEKVCNLTDTINLRFV